MVKQLGENFKIKSLPYCAIIYCLEMNSEFTPQVTYCIKVDQSLCLKLFYKGVPIPLPPWFSVGRNSRLTNWSMMPNFISYMKKRSEETKFILCELISNEFKKRPSFSAEMIRYSLELRYTSLPTYILLRELCLPSVSYLRKLTFDK